jgi:hypothetical protein
MHCRAQVVDESRQRQRPGPHAAAEHVGRLVHLNPETGLRKNDRADETVRLRADHDCTPVSRTSATPDLLLL